MLATLETMDSGSLDSYYNLNFIFNITSFALGSGPFTQGCAIIYYKV
jgi:hypothetical protein